jgi:hypothetical protein
MKGQNMNARDIQIQCHSPHESAQQFLAKWRDSAGNYCHVWMRGAMVEGIEKLPLYRRNGITEKVRVLDFGARCHAGARAALSEIPADRFAGAMAALVGDNAKRDADQIAKREADGLANLRILAERHGFGLTPLGDGGGGAGGDGGELSLSDALCAVGVIDCDELNISASCAHDAENPDDIGGAEHIHPAGWFAVEIDGNITAYFSTERAALRYRLTAINDMLNGGIG